MGIECRCFRIGLPVEEEVGELGPAEEGGSEDERPDEVPAGDNRA